MSHPIFCQTCYDRTGKVDESVYEADTSGNCSKCGSTQTMSAEVVAQALASKVRNIVTTMPREARRKIPYNTDYLRSEDVRCFLSTHSPELEKWWDGTYFEYHMWFLLPQCGNGFEIMLENQDGTQRFLVLSVQFQMEVSDVQKANQG